MNLEKADLMAGHIAHIDGILLGVFGILRTDAKSKPLLGAYTVCWEGDSQT
jgi:hypothetical protein